MALTPAEHQRGLMSIERNLPENRQRRIERQRDDAQADVTTLRTALEFAEKSIVPANGPHALRGHALDGVTLHAAQVLVKCLKADLAYALQLEASAQRIWCEEFNIDPDGEYEDPNDYVGMGWVGSDGRP